MNVQRYTWEDALIQAQTEGRIPNGALLLALKLSKAINWAPKSKKQPGLYWANEEALKAVGASRATYFKHRAVLFAEGFFVDVKGNLIPTLPQSSVETAESLVETEKSLGDNPFSDNSLSVDVLSEEEETSDKGEKQEETTSSLDRKTTDPSLGRNRLKQVVEGMRKKARQDESLVETILNDCGWSSLARDKYNDPTFKWSGDDVARAYAAVTFSEPVLERVF